MEYDFVDVQFQTFILRMIAALAILAVWYELYVISTAINNVRITRMVLRAAMFITTFFIGRIIAGIADSYFVFDIGWFSNMVNVVFWSYLAFKVRKLRKVLESDRNDTSRVALRASFDDLLDQLESARQNLQKLKAGNTTLKG